MKLNLNIIGGFCLGSLAGVLYMEACEFFPANPHQGWACIVLYIFVCLITAAFSVEKP